MLEEAPQSIPKWHWLSGRGIGLMLVSAGMIVFAWWLLPLTPSLNVEPEVQVKAVRDDLALRAFIYAVGDRLIAAGFLMWLAGHVIDGVRSQQGR